MIWQTCFSRKAKDKRLKKHFPISVGNLNVKIINYLIKRWTSRFEDIDLLVLKSNMPFPSIGGEEIIIDIQEGDNKLKILGKFFHNVSANGSYELAFTIIKKI